MPCGHLWRRSCCRRRRSSHCYQTVHVDHMYVPTQQIGWPPGLACRGVRQAASAPPPAS